MAATYKQFLATPSPALLADKAALHYVTTTTSVTGSAEVIRHLTGLSKHVQKKKEDILNTIEGDNAAVFEVETGLEFQISGGPYLPNLDDNFLSDRVAYLSITHFVTFNADGKISQIRLQWDQGSLLKQLDIIGKTGRNWPIRDSRDQLTLIQSCLKSSGHAPSGSESNHNDLVNRTRGSSSNVLRDPHATLHMGFSRQEMEESDTNSVISPYAGKTRPRQRGFTEILGDEPEDEGSPTANRHSMISPHKAGANKNFQPMRLFDGQQEHHDDEETPKGKGSTYIKPNPKKYSHFDFADGSDPQDHPEAGVSFDEKPKSKHDSQWSFQDFTTPSKPVPTRSARAQDVRHWDTEDSAASETSSTELGGRARRDAETHFELQDDGERVVHNDRNGTRARGSTQNDNMGLYKNKLFDRDDPEGESQRPLGNITNLKGRNQTFDPHFAMTDDSPVSAQRTQNVPEARKKAVKMMDANWSAYDESPKAQKENKPQGNGTSDTGINIAGNGMGGRKGTGSDFLYGGDADEDSTGINIKGDGMGGKKGTNRDWLYGEEDVPKPAAPKRGGLSQQQRTFWEF